MAVKKIGLSGSEGDLLKGLKSDSEGLASFDVGPPSLPSPGSSASSDKHTVTEGGDTGETKKVDTKKRSKDKKSAKKKKLPNIRIFYGTFVHSNGQEPMIILDRWLVGVKHGRIVFVEPEDMYSTVLEKYDVQNVQKEVTICLGEGTFMMPGFVDAHTDIVPYLALGIQDVSCDCGQTAEYITFPRQSLTDRRKEKLRLLHDDKVVEKAFVKAITRLQALGTTFVSVNGSHIESAVQLVSKALGQCNERGEVGMDMCIPNHADDLFMLQATKVEDVIATVRRTQFGELSPQIVLSGPVPDWVERKVAEIQNYTEAKVKVLTSRPPDWQKWFECCQDRGLISNKLVAVHCHNSTDSDLKLLKEKGASVVYCPSVDLKSNKLTDLDKLLASGVNIGLGSDLANSGSFSMLEVIRQCVEVSRKQPQEDRKTKLNYQHFFHLATLGGAKAVGLSDVMGNFEVGKQFDAFLVDPHVPDSPFFVPLKKDSPQDIVERFLFAGDDRNITAVYLSGQRVK